MQGQNQVANSYHLSSVKSTKNKQKKSYTRPVFHSIYISLYYPSNLPHTMISYVGISLLFLCQFDARIIYTFERKYFSYYAEIKLVHPRLISCNRWCRRWSLLFSLSKHRMGKTDVVGFDIEWKVTYTNDVRKTALIQLCPSKDICYLFHIYMMNGKVLYSIYVTYLYYYC